MATSRITIPVGGMTCAACATRIEKVLNRLPDVHAAVNFATEKAHVEYPAGTLTPDDLITAIRKAGYDAQEPTANTDADRKAERIATYHRDLQLFTISAVLTLPFFALMLYMLMGAPQGDLLRGAHHTTWFPPLAQLL
jgi:Cu+-exporting ATPase